MTALFREPLKRIDPLPTPVSVEQFIEWYPEDVYRYELYRGIIAQIPKPEGEHSKISGRIRKELAFEIRRTQWPYFIPRECIVKISDDTGFEPDAIVLSNKVEQTEPLWENASTVEKEESVKLAVEVVSSNWQDDYETKLNAYEMLGIPEYWIVDYAGLGGVRHIGKPKRPTLTVCMLVDGEYEVTRFRENEQVVSPLFPDLVFSL